MLAQSVEKILSYVAYSSIESKLLISEESAATASMSEASWRCVDSERASDWLA